MSMAELMPVTGRSEMGKVDAPSTVSNPLLRSEAFAKQLGCTCPILLAPMAGVSGTALSAAVMKAGGVGGCGAVNLGPTQIKDWASELRARAAGPFQINLWVPDVPRPYNLEAEEKQRAFLRQWGPEPYPFDYLALPNYEEQCRALLEARPKVASSMMGLFASHFVEELKSAGIAWWATVTTVAEARQAVAAGADALIVQGLEAGGHRGSFDPKEAVTHQVGLFALLPHVCDAVTVPVIAAGGIADGRTVAAAFVLGASAVQIGTAFLRTDEAGLPEVYRSELRCLEPHRAVLTPSFSGRYGRVVDNSFVRASQENGVPAALSFPKQFLMTRAMREEALRHNDIERMSMWAGQAAALGQSGPTTRFTEEMWHDARALLSSTYWAYIPTGT